MQIPLHAAQSDLERFGMTTCAHCGDLLHQDEAVVAVYYTNNMQEQEHFCGQHCKERWYINRLNTLGM